MSGVMTFLKRAGTLIVNAASLVELGYPIIGGFVPKAAATVVSTAVNDLEQFASVVTNVEAVAQAIPTGLTGDQKLAAALPLIARAVSGASVLAGKKIANKDLFNKAVNGYAQATVDMLNSIDADSVVTK